MLQRFFLSHSPLRMQSCSSMTRALSSELSLRTFLNVRFIHCHRSPFSAPSFRCERHPSRLRVRRLNHLIDQSINQSINQSIPSNQSVIQSNKQTRQSINQSSIAVGNRRRPLHAKLVAFLFTLRTSFRPRLHYCTAL